MSLRDRLGAKRDGVSGYENTELITSSVDLRGNATLPRIANPLGGGEFHVVVRLALRFGANECRGSGM